jgi:signal transduction histidine kinase
MLGVFSVQEVWGSGTLSEAVTPFVILIVGMYSAASRLRGTGLAMALAGSCLAIGGTIIVDAGGLDADSLIYALVVIAAAFVTGRLVGQRTREAGRLADEKALLVAEREEREREAVARERMRIAHELHDLITHRVSAMVLQASTERRIIEQGEDASVADPATLRATLESVETLGREAMSELRQLLGALFHEGDELRAPQPGTDDLKTLVEQTSRADVDASLEVKGRRRRLTTPLEVSLYRLAQEALSNAMRHAPGSVVRVVMDYRPDAVELTVTNTAGRQAGPRDPGLGLGIPGMRERARQFGGNLETNVTADGGFSVRAHFPAPDRPGKEYPE